MTHCSARWGQSSDLGFVMLFECQKHHFPSLEIYQIFRNNLSWSQMKESGRKWMGTDLLGWFSPLSTVGGEHVVWVSGLNSNLAKSSPTDHRWIVVAQPSGATHIFSVQTFFGNQTNVEKLSNFSTLFRFTLTWTLPEWCLCINPTPC